jgi:hypothetical protein
VLSKPALLNNQELKITVSGDTESSGVVHLDWITADYAKLQSPRPVKAGDAVRLDAGHVLLAGTCRSCVRGDGRFEVVVELSQITPCVSDLGKLIGAVLAATPKRSHPERSTAEHPFLKR